ncbi:MULTISPECIES: putative T7SS-secreted protein [unclassified Microbacterium]|uniref:putative T7SS-secreted protein n=1 Tax=unclassified Microbacterium TaxID=2609290 RepID=UPI003865081F
MTVLPGEPDVLTSRAGRLTRSAERILTVVQEMRGIVDDDEGEAVRALHDQNDQLATDLERIHPRYEETASAITEYAVALTGAHERAERAQDDLDEALDEQTRADSALRSLSDQVDAADDPSPSLTGRVPGAQRAADDAQEAVAAAQDRIDAAREDMITAAERAMNRIDDAIDATNEGFWDKVGDVFSDIGDWIAGIAEWIEDFLGDVLALLTRILATIVAALGVLLVLLLILAIGALFGTIGLIIAGLVVAAFAAFLIASILSDVLKPTPEVSATDPYVDDELNRPDLPSLETVLDGTGEVDTLGGEDESVVKITKVLGPDGWQYTVTLPSTQEWLSRLGDKGAVNDLDSNLALMLTPALQTQYERAVLDAMAAEGISPDDPVMLVGFSQGGIMAGHLAAYNTDYNWQAVVASGAPIDHMPIPDSVDVVSVQHNGDPVPRLDTVTGDLGTEHGPNWTSIRVDPPNPDPVLGVDPGAHNADKYSSTYQDHLDEITAAHPDLADFFNDDGYTDVSYYRWNE